MYQRKLEKDIRCALEYGIKDNKNTMIQCKKCDYKR